MYDSVSVIKNILFLIITRQVLEVVAKLKEISEEDLALISYENSLRMFNIH